MDIENLQELSTEICNIRMDVMRLASRPLMPSVTKEDIIAGYRQKANEVNDYRGKAKYAARIISLELDENE